MTRRFTNKAALSGFTLIEMIIVVAIIATLAAIAIPNYIAYRDKGFCTTAEYDAGNILASLSCYFAEPDNRGCNDLSSLVNDPNCGFSMNNEQALLTQSGQGSAAYWVIEVTDTSSRCPRSDFYSTYMGTSAGPNWND